MNQDKDQAALLRLQAVRWGDTPRCAVCDSEHVRCERERDRLDRWRCRTCASRFTLFTRTLFAGTRTPLSAWFGMIRAVASQDERGTVLLARELDIPQQTAWRIREKIVAALAGGDPIVCALAREEKTDAE